ncbi:MAG: hypothetical protein JRI25_05155 [Deltaproteobacteria bacterium]|nr:hypothetical protein [Deltaproteobacteria bacterium]MBW2253969.1 hypothetical protein [Deltaproteobacteria bacterium]
MKHLVLLFPLFIACGPGYGLIDDGDDLLDEASEYDGASLRIVSPSSGTFLALEDSHEFSAVLYDAEGIEMTWEEVQWTSSADADWTRDVASFTDDTLEVGIHDITAEVTLPNGDRLAHTVGGILVQSFYAGTYSGLFHSEVTYDAYTVPCSGSVLIIVDPWGEVAAGGADCVTSLMGFDTELSYIFDLQNDAGVLSGTAGADLFGWYTLDVPASGTLDPNGIGLTVDFGGDFMEFISLGGTVEAARVSLDAGM